ncbi:MAG: bifunctional UDP-sugar hydrolase/5'-nucleotidase [Proteobacteria bacterium]|nr:MAG: bifunctional UDP-sugar hydrolase/5'-nucleotidase [Pseudomonadota bacterium]
MKFHPFILPVLAACCIVNPIAAKEWQDDKTYQLTILHTNDNHGQFWHNRHGEYGMPARYTVINAVRRQVEAAGGSVLLLSGGDINTGVPESDLQDAEPDFVGMKKMGYDAMALGNHEFDNPLEVLTKQQTWAGFPFLSANIYAKDTGKRMFQPYSVIDKQGIKIAIIGLTTEDTAKIGNPEYLANVEFRDPKAEAIKVVKELKETVKPDLILAVTHMGHYDNGKHGYNAPGDVSLARALPEGAVTAVIGGHSQEPVCMASENVRNANYKAGEVCKPDFQNGTYIMQAHEWGKYVGRADFEFKNGKATLKSYRLIPINLKKKVKDAEGNSKRVFIDNEIAQNKEMLALLGPYLNKGKASLNIKVGNTNKLLVGARDKVRFGQTNLGRLIATAQMEKAKADFGIMNSGGIRASIETGDITYKEVLTVHPFANTLTSVAMKGADVLDYLNVVALKPTDTGAYAQFAGISMTVGKDAVSNVKIGGEPLDPEKEYRFSLPSFAAAGGDGYPKVSDMESYIDTGFVDADVLKEYLEHHNPLDADAFAPNGEIVYAD